MYTPDSFPESDVTVQHDFTERNSFGRLVSQDSGSLVATHHIVFGAKNYRDSLELESGSTWLVSPANRKGTYFVDHEVENGNNLSHVSPSGLAHSHRTVRWLTPPAMMYRPPGLRHAWV